MRQSLLTAALTASLLVPAAGQPLRLDSLWTVLSLLWSAVSVDEGCGMDPFGCSPAQKLNTDEGCGADPNGRCSPTQQLNTDEGCGMDPSGRCNTTQRLETDAGCGMDPNGLCDPGR